jgi:hypothetical protein
VAAGVERLEIGRVVASNDQTDYLVQIHAPGEVPEPPSPADYGFGHFVGIPIDGDTLIGVIYTTQLVNPAYGTLGPRLSTEQELPVFSPDYLPETATVVGVALLGSRRCVGTGDSYDQATPATASAIDAPVRVLSDEEFVSFHFPEGRLRFAYFPRLLARTFPSLPDLLCSILDRIATSRPAESGRLDVARRNIRWHAVVGNQ